MGCVSIQVGLLVYGMTCSIRGWGCCLRDGVLIYGMGC